MGQPHPSLCIYRKLYEPSHYKGSPQGEKTHLLFWDRSDFVAQAVLKLTVSRDSPPAVSCLCSPRTRTAGVSHTPDLPHRLDRSRSFGLLDDYFTKQDCSWKLLRTFSAMKSSTNMRHDFLDLCLISVSQQEVENLVGSQTFEHARFCVSMSPGVMTVKVSSLV